MASEGRRRSSSTSRTSGAADRASFAICSREGLSGRASSPHISPGFVARAAKGSELAGFSRLDRRRRGCITLRRAYGACVSPPSAHAQ